MALDACLLVVCMILVVSSSPLDDDDAALATRTLLAAAVFDGRVMPAPGIDGHLLFRVRRVYKGWHGGQLPRRRPATAAERLILVGCGSSPELDGGGGRSTDCRLDSAAAAVGRGRYLVFARSFHAVVVGTGRRRGGGGGTPVGVYRTSVPLLPVTARARRVVARYSNLGFGQSVSAAARFSPLNYLCRR